jgi:acyl transferase domain-containing protein
LPGLGVRSASNGDIVFQAEVSAASDPFLADHAVYGSVIFPAAGYLGLAIGAAAQLGASQSTEVVGLSLHEAMLFRDEERRHVQTILSPANADGGHRFTVYSATCSDQPPTQWTRHASGEVRGLAASVEPAAVTTASPALEEHRVRTELSARPRSVRRPGGSDWPHCQRE